MKRSLTILAIVAGLLVGCDEENDPLPFEKQVTLLAGTKGGSKAWKLESTHINGSILVLEDCEKDNIYTFYNNDLQVYTITGGAQKCDATEPQVLEDGAWMFAADGKTMIISASRIFADKFMNFIGTVTARPAKILELTETSFKIEINVVDGVNSDSANIIMSFKAN